MNRTIKEATVKRYHYSSHDELKAHMQTFLMAYNFARRLKTLKGLTPFEYICKIWSEDPDRFIINPHYHTVGINTLRVYILLAKEHGPNFPWCRPIHTFRCSRNSYDRHPIAADLHEWNPRRMNFMHERRR
jgi:hypothetical protein